MATPSQFNRGYGGGMAGRGPQPVGRSPYDLDRVATYVSGVRTVQALTSSMEVVARGYNNSGSFNAIWGQS